MTKTQFNKLMDLSLRQHSEIERLRHDMATILSLSVSADSQPATRLLYYIAEIAGRHNLSNAAPNGEKK